MSIESAVMTGFAGLAGLCKAETWRMGIGKVLERPSRLEAVFYASDGYQALEAMRHSQFELSTIGAFARILWFGPFARKYVDDPAHGTAFLTSSTMMEARPKAGKLVSNKHTGHLPALRVHDGYILVSCSGTIGNVALCTKDVDGWACFQDAIRVIVSDRVDLGSVYCLLQSALGQFLIERSQTGSVVRHIYEPDVANLPIPCLPLALRRELTERVCEVSALRVEANRLLQEADGLIYSVNQIDRSHLGKRSECEILTSSSRELLVQYENKDYHRLEATYRNRSSAEAILLVKAGKNYQRLIDTVSSIPFTGPGSMPGVSKVGSEFGVGAVTARDLRKTRPAPSYYLASRRKHLVEQMIPMAGSTLVMCAGTLGATDYVRGNYEKWAVSLDVIRVNPNPDLLHPGYLHAFLSSDLGQRQMLQHRYGSVIPRIHSRQIAEILIPVPTDKGAGVGELVDLAFDKRANALQIENAAIDLFAAAVKTGRQATESQWGQ